MTVEAVVAMVAVVAVVAVAVVAAAELEGGATAVAAPSTRQC